VLLTAVNFSTLSILCFFFCCCDNRNVLFNMLMLQLCAAGYNRHQSEPWLGLCCKDREPTESLHVSRVKCVPVLSLTLATIEFVAFLDLCDNGYAWYIPFIFCSSRSWMLPLDIISQCKTLFPVQVMDCSIPEIFDSVFSPPYLARSWWNSVASSCYLF
jgi:hypothetical protein